MDVEQRTKRMQVYLANGGKQALVDAMRKADQDTAEFVASLRLDQAILRTPMNF